MGALAACAFGAGLNQSRNFSNTIIPAMTLHDFNTLPKDELVKQLMQCCGSKAWVERMLKNIPAEDMVEVLEDAEEEWWKCSSEDWKEAFSHHPKIGDLSKENKSEAAANLAAKEQSGVANASMDILEKLKSANKAYEDKFGYIFIVFASGKSAEEMLTILNMRLQNSPETEIEIAADEQNKNTKARLEKLLEE